MIVKEFMRDDVVLEFLPEIQKRGIEGQSAGCGIGCPFFGHRTWALYERPLFQELTNTGGHRRYRPALQGTGSFETETDGRHVLCVDVFA